MKEKEDSNNNKFIFEDEEDDLDSLKKLDEHDMEEEVSSVICLSDGRIAALNEDGLLKVFSIKKDKFNLEIEEKLEAGSFIVEMRHNTLVTHCFGYEYIIKIEGNKIKQIKTCESIFNVTVYKIEKINDNQIAQCSNNKVIEIIEFNETKNDEYQCIKKYLQINEDGSNDFKVNGLCLHPNVEVLTLFYQKEFNRLISGSRDKILRVWDLNELSNKSSMEDMVKIKPLFEIKNIDVCVGNTISCYNDLIFTGGIGHINVLKKDNYEVIKSLNLDEKFKMQFDIFAVETFHEFGGLYEVVVVGVNQGGALMIFDNEELMLYRTEPIHQGTVNNICKIKDSGLIATGSQDGYIKLFRYSDKKLITI